MKSKITSENIDNVINDMFSKTQIQLKYLKIEFKNSYKIYNYLFTLSHFFSIIYNLL